MCSHRDLEILSLVALEHKKTIRWRIKPKICRLQMQVRTSSKACSQLRIEEAQTMERTQGTSKSDSGDPKDDRRSNSLTPMETKDLKRSDQGHLQ